jgi:hypothetical protein
MTNAPYVAIDFNPQAEGLTAICRRAIEQGAFDQAPPEKPPCPFD